MFPDKIIEETELIEIILSITDDNAIDSNNASASRSIVIGQQREDNNTSEQLLVLPSRKDKNSTMYHSLQTPKANDCYLLHFLMFSQIY